MIKNLKNTTEQPLLSLGINILSYSVEIALMDLFNMRTLEYSKEILPDGDDPLPFTAELIKKIIPHDTLNKIHYFGLAFPGKIDSDHQYILESSPFPEYYMRSFCKDLLLTLKLKNTQSYTYSYVDCEFLYNKYILKHSNSFMIIFLKQGVSALMSEIQNWHKNYDWYNLGHFHTNSKKACTCGNFGCLQTEAGDISCAKKFNNKISFEYNDLLNFIKALHNKNIKAQEILKESVSLILNTIHLYENFQSLPESLMFSANFPDVSFDIIRNIIKDKYKNKISSIFLHQNSTVTGAALIPLENR